MEPLPSINVDVANETSEDQKKNKRFFCPSACCGSNQINVIDEQSTDTVNKVKKCCCTIL